MARIQREGSRGDPVPMRTLVVVCMAVTADRRLWLAQITICTQPVSFEFGVTEMACLLHIGHQPPRENEHKRRAAILTEMPMSRKWSVGVL